MDWMADCMRCLGQGIKGGCPDFSGQDFETIRETCLARGLLFVDEAFPPIESTISTIPSSLRDKDEWSLSDDEVRKLRRHEELTRDVEWIRASELVEDPKFFVDGPTRFDVSQGRGNNCWFLAATANLAMIPEIRRKVIPSDQGFGKENKYAGIFHFRFWQFGEWIDVVVDDFLPVKMDKDGGRHLVFNKSSESNEFWSALMEKAYAKIHGSYKDLDFGVSASAMVDFTGGCSEIHRLDDSNEYINIPELMLKCYKAGTSLLAGSIDKDPKGFDQTTSMGLYRQHTYSITKVINNAEYKLVRLRNPWGKQFWEGPWSEKSTEWSSTSDEEKECLGLNYDNAGEFYMSVKDFVDQFDQLEICHMGLRFEGLANWHVQSIKGSWQKESTAGGWWRQTNSTFDTNPQFLVTLTDSDEDEDSSATCVISLMRITPVNGVWIGFTLCKSSDKPGRLDKDYLDDWAANWVDSTNFEDRREVSKRFKKPPGGYVVVPSTWYSGVECEFLLRVFTEKQADIKLLE